MKGRDPNGWGVDGRYCPHSLYYGYYTFTKAIKKGGLLFDSIEFFGFLRGRGL